MNTIMSALLWLDAEPARYWTVAWLAFALVAALAWAPAETSPAAPRWWTRPWLFALAVPLALAAWRWPVWFCPHELNPDEAQTIAGAITLTHFPVYWKYVDGTTHGPVCEYLLLAAHAFGAPLNYFTARVVACLLQAGALLAAWRTLRLFAPERVARAGILPALAFWAFVSWEDFVHYSTELPGIALLALATWAAAAIWRTPAWSSRHFATAFAAGLALGLVPFAKLQSVPQGLALAGLLPLVLWRGRNDLAASARRRLVALFVAGGLLPAAATAVFVTVFGLWTHFWASYILNALDYVKVTGVTLGAMPGKFFNFAATEPAFSWYLWGSLAFALVYARTPVPAPPLRWVRTTAGVLAAVAYYSVLGPAREVAHYLHLLVIPLALVTGSAVAVAAATPEPAAPARRRFLPWAFLAALAILPQIGQRAVSWHPHAGQVAGYRTEPPSAAARFLIAHARPGDTLAMWGWEPHLFVETQLPHGTREAHTASQMLVWSLQPYFLNRYLWDLERRQPAWFVDAVGPGAFGYADRATHGHETVPELRQLIATRYELVAELDAKRIYHRKDAGGNE